MDMDTVFSTNALGKMSYEDLADQCIHACIQHDRDRAERIYHNDVAAKLRLKNDHAATMAAHRAQVRMREAIQDLFPCREEAEAEPEPELPGWSQPLSP